MIKKIINFTALMVFVSSFGTDGISTLINKTGRDIILTSIELGQITGQCNAGIITNKPLANGASYDVDTSGPMCRIRRISFGYQGGASGGLSFDDQGRLVYQSGSESIYGANTQKFPVATTEQNQMFDPNNRYTIIDCGNDSFSLVPESSGLTTCGTIISVKEIFDNKDKAQAYAQTKQEALKDASKK